MRKFICTVVLFAIIMSTISFSISAEKDDSDPYYEHHLKISYYIDGLRDERNAQIQPIQEKIDSYRNESIMLYNERSVYNSNAQDNYDNLIETINTLENEISCIEQEYYNEINKYLSSIGFNMLECMETEESIDNIHFSATDAGNMQTESYTYYDATYGEFYYFVEYDYNETSGWGEYVGLDDLWGDYDLVSMQHKDNSEWYWNNIIVTANLLSNFPTSSLVGKADKYGILDNGITGTSFVSNREDFWNGCIFNVKDDKITMAQGHVSRVRYITIEGWLLPSGTAKTTHVKSEYEHNYEKWILSAVEIQKTSLDNTDFSMNITYKKSSGIWRRSAGSRICILPN